MSDLENRLRAAGIEHVLWKNSEVNPAQLVLVSADVRGQWNFLSYASLLVQKRLLRRIVIDECHLTYTASHYRRKLDDLKHLRSLSYQIVLLTATQPPLLEHVLAESMLVRGVEYIRSSTVRIDVRYFVQRCPMGKLLEMAEAIFERRKPLLRGDKGIAYCRYRNDSEDLVSRVSRQYCHSHFQGVPQTGNESMKQFATKQATITTKISCKASKT